MPTTREDISRWLDRAKEKGATHLIVVCDTFDHDDYPVFVGPNENARSVFDEYQEKNMQRVMEVYRLDGDLDAQLSQHRSFNF